MVAFGVLVALLTLTSVVANTCYFSQEPDQRVDSGHYHWVLSDNPCLCAKFRLGGVNTVPSQRPVDPVRFFDASLLRKHPDEIRDSIGCIEESSLYNTSASREIEYPFDPFKSALLVYIDVTVSDLRIYLTTKDLSSKSPPPYLIEFQGDKLSVATMLTRGHGVYTDVVSEVIPGSEDGRHFWLYYRYDASSAVIQVGLNQTTTEYVDYSPPQETTYLGTFSSEAAEWKLRHYLKT